MPMCLRPAPFLKCLPAIAVIAACTAVAGPAPQAQALNAIPPEGYSHRHVLAGNGVKPGLLPERVAEPNLPAGGGAMRYNLDQAAEPEVLYDVSLLPEPVRRMRRLILEACRSGDLEKLRPLIGSGPGATQLSFGAPGDDPIAFLREISGDTEGHEILAILLEVMEAGFVRLNAGTEQELYVWPYFFALPLAELTAKQRVELFELVTAGDYEDMKAFGAYIFYRAAITPEGRWVYFVAGD